MKVIVFGASGMVGGKVLYTVAGPLFPILTRLIPNQVTSTVKVGRAMIRCVMVGSEKRVLETRDINLLAVGV